MDGAQMRTWAEIDLAALTHNYHALRGMLPPGCRFLGVVKADAYGHGATQVAQRLVTLGCECLGVACLDEAVALRTAGLTAPILILGYTPPEFAATLGELGLTQTVFDRHHALALSQAFSQRDKPLAIHIKVDTGMSRLGFAPQEAEEIARICRLPGLQAEGIFTHFADADACEDYTMTQLTRFLDLLDTLARQGVTFAIRHCAASAAVLHYPCTHLDMVRPGIALYGHYPHPDTQGLDGVGLRPVMSLKSRVISVKELPAGTPVSYGRTHVLSRTSRLAVLPLGYADGYPRSLAGVGGVLLEGVYAPQVGRVCMDLSMVDVTHLPQIAPGHVATIFGQDLPLEEKSQAAGTISYELLCAVSKRVPRIYR